MKPTLKPGLTAKKTITVDEPRVISFMGEDCRVYATPRTIGDLEYTCRDFLLAHLDPGEDSVGTKINWEHVGPALLGAEVTISVTLVGVDGRRMSFEAKVDEGAEAVARGSRAGCTVCIEKNYPVTVNDPALTAAMLAYGAPLSVQVKVGAAVKGGQGTMSDDRTSVAAAAPDGTIALTLYKAGFIVGGAGGNGTLTFKGKQYPVELGGISLGATIGASKAELIGEVYNIKNPSDIEGTYSAVQAGVAVVGGGKVAELKNSKGVVLKVKGKEVGLELALDLSGMGVSLKK